MRLLKRFIIGILIMVMAVMVEANPIPWPLPAKMPLEDMYSVLEETRPGRLRETFLGNYYFSYIPEDLSMMKYPVPPRSRGISVAMGKLPGDWEYSPDAFPFLHEMQLEMDPLVWSYIRELYPTVLPQWPGIPMIAWRGPFPGKALLSVKYQHDLISNLSEHIYFYALGTGKYYETYQKEAVSFLDISMPLKYTMRRLYLDKTPHAFAMTCERDEEGKVRRVVSIHATARFGPFRKDIIGYISPLWPFGYFTPVKEIDDFLPEDMGVGLEEENIPDIFADAGGMKRSSRANADIVSFRVPPQIRFNYKVKECGTTEPPVTKPEVIPWGRRMIVKDAIYFNCCPEYIRMTILVNGTQVIFREKAMEEAPCDCNCYYPMWGSAGPFLPGTYQVELVNPYGRTILEKEVVIE